jgi:hypothetical protein
MLFREMIGVCRDNHVKVPRFLMSRQMVHIITSELQMINNII